MKILVLHASAGAGHRRAAQALAKACKLQNRQNDVVVTDVLDFTPISFRETYAKGYLYLVRHVPEVWGYVYSQTDNKAQKPWKVNIRSAFNRLNVTNFLEFYNNFNPDMAICTHFMPLEVLSSRIKKQRIQTPIYGIITDFAVHSLWVVEHVTHYYVASQEARRHLIRRGQPEQQVSVKGIPIDPIFSEYQSPQIVRKKLGLNPNLPTILVLSGGYGVGQLSKIITSFERTNLNYQIIGVAGANEDVFKKAQRAAEKLSIPSKIFGYVDNIHELMDAADLVITKPGGLSTSEILAKGKPMVIIDPIPGQEQRNCEYLLESGIALRLYEAEDTPYKVSSLLENPKRLQQMKENAILHGKPNAAQEIITDILGG